MLGSAWEWLVSLVVASQDGVPVQALMKASGKVAHEAVWQDGDWNETDERAMVECILAEEVDASCSSRLRDLKFQHGGAEQPLQGETCKDANRGWLNPAGPQEQECQISSWQGTPGGTLKALSDVPALPPLEYDLTPSPVQSKTVTQALDAVVCQTSKIEEAVAGVGKSGSFWPSLLPGSKPTPTASPKSVFDVFPDGECLLPPQSPAYQGKRTLVLDLDETLVHSVFHPVSIADFTLKVQLEQGPLDVYVLKRPGVDNFLRVMASHFEVVIFTASVKEYAEPLLDILDPEGLVCHRLFRDSCTNPKNGYVKDLTRLERSLADVIIVDNSPHAYAFQPDNALPILSYYDDASDRELQKITPFLESLGSLPGDVRSLLTAALGTNVKNLLQTRLSFLL